MIYFIGAGPGATDLITVRGMRLLQKADVVIYAGSLVNPELLDDCRPETTIYNSASMTLEQTVAAMRDAPEGATVVRLHTGDPCLINSSEKSGISLTGRYHFRTKVMYFVATPVKDTLKNLL